MSNSAPLEPTLTAHLFAPLGQELVRLLRGLHPSDWRLPTVCPAWTVQDIAAHLLDSACRRVAVGRDGHFPPPPERPPADYPSLLAFLDGLNAEWVKATRRLSPRLLVDLLEWIEPQLAESLAGLDPWAEARFSVAWAGEERSANWFDVARELTERWHHQQQIRLAVGASPLTDPAISRPIFDTFLRALPHRYRQLSAADGASLSVAIVGTETYLYRLEKQTHGWQLLAGSGTPSSTTIRLPEEDAWLLLTHGLGGTEAARRAEISGEAAFAAPFFKTLAVMA